MATLPDKHWTDTLRDKWYHPVIPPDHGVIRGFSPTTVVVDEFGNIPSPVFKIKDGAISATSAIVTTTQHATVAANDLGEKLRDMVEIKRALEDRGISVSEIMRNVMGFKFDEMRVIDSAMERADRERAEKERAELEKIPGFGVF